MLSITHVINAAKAAGYTHMETASRTVSLADFHDRFNVRSPYPRHWRFCKNSAGQDCIAEIIIDGPVTFSAYWPLVKGV